MMRDALTAALLEKADEVGALLNQVEDDDAREKLQDVYEQQLNAVLFIGSQERAQRLDDPGARAELDHHLRLTTPSHWGTSL